MMWDRLSVCCGICCLIAVGCQGDEAATLKRLPPSPESQNSPDDVRPDSNPAEPDLRISAAELFDKVQEDPDAFKAKYSGKSVEVTGILVTHNISLASGDVTIFLETNDERSWVFCLMKADKKPWVKAAPGQTVTIRGSWPANWAGKDIANCEIMDVAGDPPATITVEEFADQFLNEKGTAFDQFDQQYRYVVGTIKEKKENEYEFPTMYFETPQGIELIHSFNKSATGSGSFYSEYDVGDRVKFLGQFDMSNSQRDRDAEVEEIFFRTWLPIEKVTSSGE